MSEAIKVIRYIAEYIAVLALKEATGSIKNTFLAGMAPASSVRFLSLLLRNSHAFR